MYGISGLTWPQFWVVVGCMVLALIAAVVWVAIGADRG